VVLGSYRRCLGRFRCPNGIFLKGPGGPFFEFSSWESFGGFGRLLDGFGRSKESLVCVVKLGGFCLFFCFVFFLLGGGLPRLQESRGSLVPCFGRSRDGFEGSLLRCLGYSRGPTRGGVGLLPSLFRTSVGSKRGGVGVLPSLFRTFFFGVPKGCF
jgi:hypothetical protein